MKYTALRLPLLLCTCCLLLCNSCTEAKLEPIPPIPQYRDDKVRLSGELCTSEPETLIFPLRVLFVIDSSVSMEVTDPPDPVTGTTGREDAIRDIWTDLLDQGPEGVKIGIVRFSSQARSRTAQDLDGDSLPDTYYTADTNLLDVATASLAVTDRTTNYINALGEAYFEMRTELLAADQESLPLSKYVIVFLSDGIPDVDNAQQRATRDQQILESVEALNKLAEDFRVGEFAFHTAFISSGQEAFDLEAQALLEGMASEGNGSFRSFPNGEELNFLFIDLTILKRIFTIKTLSVLNLNAVLDKNQLLGEPPPLEEEEEEEAMEEEEVPIIIVDGEPEEVWTPDQNMFVDLNGDEQMDCGEPMVDTDGDGLSDFVEIRIGTDPFIQDSDDDGLKDFLEWQFTDSGLDALDPEDSQCYIPSPCIDENNDMLCDCILDFDADGLCDCIDPPVACAYDGNDAPDCVPYDPVPPGACANGEGLDCVDEDEDGLCDCPDADLDGRCDYDDRDADDIHDCEEVFWGTAQLGVDTDADGLPDLSEIRFQTNPSKYDIQEDLDADSTPNGTEVLAQTDPVCDDASVRSRTSYRYTLEQTGLEGATTCYDFDVSNITLVPTLARREGTDSSELYPGDGWNRILIYAGEVAFDDPRAFARYRVACVMASYSPDGNFKSPPSGRVRLSSADFIPAQDFDADVHCRYPAAAQDAADSEN